MSISALLLDGWDETSTWGFDNGTPYAQLTPNGVLDDDGPQMWIIMPRHDADDTLDLARAIADATGASLEDVSVAMRCGRRSNTL